MGRSTGTRSFLGTGPAADDVFVFVVVFTFGIRRGEVERINVVLVREFGGKRAELLVNLMVVVVETGVSSGKGEGRRRASVRVEVWKCGRVGELKRRRVGEY